MTVNTGGKNNITTPRGIKNRTSNFIFSKEFNILSFFRPVEVKQYNWNTQLVKAEGVHKFVHWGSEGRGWRLNLWQTSKNGGKKHWIYSYVHSLPPSLPLLLGKGAGCSVAPRKYAWGFIQYTYECLSLECEIHLPLRLSDAIDNISLDSGIRY